jgi:hypothetical protein
MFALLILPILVSGFIVLTINPNEKLKLHRYDGQLLYLKSAKIGLRYFFFVTLCSFLLKDISFEWTLSENGTSIASADIVDNKKSVDSGSKSVDNHTVEPIKTNVAPKDKLTIQPNPVQLKNRSHFDPSVVSYIAKKISEVKNEKKVSNKTLEQSWLLSLSFLTVFLAYTISIAKLLFFIFKSKISRSFYNNDVVAMNMLGKILKDSPIDYMFYESLIKRKPILISMKSRKIYVGIVNKPGEPSESNAPNQEISLVPAISGYRDKDTLKVLLQSEYTIPLDYDASLVVKVDQIESVSWFSKDVYDGVNGNIEPTPPSPLAQYKWWAIWWAKLRKK